MLNMSLNNDTYPEVYAKTEEEMKYEIFKAILWLSIIPTISLMGIFGNSIGIGFLLRRKVKRSFYILLLAVLVTDVLYLLTSLIQASVVILEYFDKSMAEYITCQTSMRLRISQIMIYNTCAYLITCMSLERLTCILFPLRTKRLNLQRYAIACVVSGIVLNAAYISPVLIFHESPKFNSSLTVYTCSKFIFKWENSDGSLSKNYSTAIIILTRIFPAVVTFIANVVLISILLKRRRQRATLFADSNRADKFDELIATLTLILISMFLVISLLTIAAVQLMAHNFPDVYLDPGRKEHYTYKIAFEIGQLASFLSAGNDFIVYLLLSKRSRMLLKQYFRNKRCRCLKSGTQTRYSSCGKTIVMASL